MLLFHGIGLSCWRILKSAGSSYVMEKLFIFSGCNEWISSMIFEPKNDKVFGIVENSVYVFSVSERRVVTVLSKVHEAPVTRACWYPRSQYYLTGCR